ncbi:hypothetical protein ACP275_07G078000 [Erythranthe tilingii]
MSSANLLVLFIGLVMVLAIPNCINGGLIGSKYHGIAGEPEPPRAFRNKIVVGLHSKHKRPPPTPAPACTAAPAPAPASPPQPIDFNSNSNRKIGSWNLNL